MHRSIVFTLACFSLTGGKLHAQRLAEPRFRAAIPAPALSVNAFPAIAPRRAHPALLLLGGVLGGAAGVLGGAAIGVKATQDDCENCFFNGLVYGSVAGGSALLPLGVHLANGRRGSYGTSLLASLAIGAAGLGTALATNEGGVMIAVPVLQLVSSVVIERRTSR
jgi:hypothetical protein